MTICSSPGCAEPGTVAGKFSTWCDSHAVILRHVATELGTRKRSKSIPPAKTAAARAKLDEANARKMAATVRATAEPVAAADLAARVGMHSANATAYKNALELAKARGWLAIQPGRGFVAGPADPTDDERRATPRPARERALKLARAVHAADAPLSTQAAAEALGVSPRSITRIAREAAEQGWITSQRGRRGYAPTDAPLPTD